MAEPVRVANLPNGTPVQVRDRLEFAFRSGFQVTETTERGYRLRRMSDGSELPVDFAPSEVRVDASARG